VRNAAALAQWVLSLITTPESAAAAIGDLIETGAGPVRIWTVVVGQVLRALPLALAAFLAQFFIFAIQARIVLRYIPGYGFRWYAGISCVATQVLIGYLIARYGNARALGICLLVVLTDCLFGGFRNNNAGINMAIWAVPLLAATVIVRRRVVHV
jgi:hypothetical protein